MPELLLKKVSELSFQMHLFRSPPDTLIEDHRQVRGPLFYDSGQFAREQVCPKTQTSRPVDSARFGGLREGIDSHIRQLRSDLEGASFQKVEKRVHAFYDSDPISRVVPSAKSQTEAGDQ